MTEQDIELYLIEGNTIKGDEIFVYLATYPKLFRKLKISLVSKITEISKFGVIILQGNGKASLNTDELAKNLFIKSQ